MITRINEAAILVKHVTVNAISILELAIQIKKEIMKHVDMSVKCIVCTLKLIVGILTYVFVRMVSI